MITKRHAIALLASSLLLSACGPTPVAPAGGPAPDPTPGAAGTPAATEPPAEAPTTAPSAAATAAPIASAAPTASAPTPDPSRRVILSGTVFDLAGATVDRATVRIRSLDASAPYQATATTVAGSYVFNDVPEGANVEVVASRDGWTTRVRVAAFQKSERRNVLDFGSPRSGGDGTGAAYFLSKYPEIVRTEPADAAVGVDPTKLVYKLTLSEPLDKDGRSRFADAVRVLPANDAANGERAGTTRDLSDLEDDGYPLDRAIDDEPDTAPYAIEDGTTFRGDAGTAAKVTWNAMGTEATLTFGAPLAASDDDEAAYQVVLASGGPTRRIRDMDGDQLGTDANGKHAAYPAEGAWVLGAFKARDLRLRGIAGLADGSSEERWAATHDNVAGFEVRPDEVDPRLIGVEVDTRGNDTRIALTFSEAMATFDGSATGLVGGGLGAVAADLANFTFMAAEREGDLDHDLEGDAEAVDPTADARLARAMLEDEFRFAPGAFAADRASAGLGGVFVEIDEDDPTRVLLWIVGRPDFFREARAIRARVEGVSDPAGNGITSRAADDDQPIDRL